jgi:hypothetical protein
MNAKVCPHCGAVSYGWGPFCGGCGLDEDGGGITEEMIARACETVRQVAQQSLLACRRREVETE